MGARCGPAPSGDVGETEVPQQTPPTCLHSVSWEIEGTVRPGRGTSCLTHTPRQPRPRQSPPLGEAAAAGTHSFRYGRGPSGGGVSLLPSPPPEGDSGSDCVRGLPTWAPGSELRSPGRGAGLRGEGPAAIMAVWAPGWPGLAGGHAYTPPPPGGSWPGRQELSPAWGGAFTEQSGRWAWGPEGFTSQQPAQDTASCLPFSAPARPPFPSASPPSAPLPPGNLAPAPLRAHVIPRGISGTLGAFQGTAPRRRLQSSRSRCPRGSAYSRKSPF